MEKENIFHSLIEGISCEIVCDAIFQVLSTADLFLDTIFYFQNQQYFRDIYDSAITKAKQKYNSVAIHNLLVCKAFSEIWWSNTFLKQAEEIEKENPSLISGEAKGKRMCYYGTYLLINSSTNTGSEILERGIAMMSCENTTLKALCYQILALYFKFTKDLANSVKFHELAITECKNRKDLHIFSLALKDVEKDVTEEEEDEIPDSHSQPLIMAFTLLVSRLAKKYHMENIIQRLVVIVSDMVNEIEIKAKYDYYSYLALFNNMCSTLAELQKQPEACRSLQRVHELILEEYGDEHPNTANSYFSIGQTQYRIKDYDSALNSFQQALNIILKLYEDNKDEHTHKSYFMIGLTQNRMNDYDSALKSHQQALNIRLKLLGDEHPHTADSYCWVGITQHEMKDYDSAMKSQQKSLNIRLKLHGDEHPGTVKSYDRIRATQCAMKAYESALQ